MTITREMCKDCVGPGWNKLLDKIYDSIEKNVWCWWKPITWFGNFPVIVVQVKEKFGGLRFYYAGGTTHLQDLIDVLCDKSYETCENCGQPGRVRDDGWIKTRCDSCQEKSRAMKERTLREYKANKEKWDSENSLDTVDSI